jgi:hypothetical protein
MCQSTTVSMKLTARVLLVAAAIVASVVIVLAAANLIQRPTHYRIGKLPKRSKPITDSPHKISEGALIVSTKHTSACQLI